MRFAASLLLIAGVMILSGCHENALEPLVVYDQVGYLPDFPVKFFLVNPPFPPGSFKILSGDERVVTSGTFALKSGKGALSGDRVCEASTTLSEGEYWMEIDGFRYGPIVVKRSVYQDALKKMLSFYYLQRCGTSVSLDGFSHGVCHLQDKRAVYHPKSGFSGVRDVSGGWHDAGNYEKYSNNTAFTVLHLLLAWELFRPQIDFIPDGDPALPDVLEEAKVGLDWLMKMQRESGAIHHSVVVKSWDYWGCSPEDHEDVRYITMVTSFDTAYAAAAFATGARVFEEFDPEYSRELLSRAELAWSWLKDHPSFVPEGGYYPLTETDAYEDDDDLSERLWAASELYKATGKEEYREYFEEKFAEAGPISTFPGWWDPKALAFASYYFSNGSDEVREEIKRQIVSYVKARIEWMESSMNAYGVALGRDGVSWGSNTNLGEIALLMILAYEMTGDEEYLEAAVEQVHYLFGRNPFGMSFVTAVGENPPSHPHHGPSIADGRAWPGMVVGGPNRFREDEAVRREIPAGTPPLKVYIDDWESYSTNEPDICYNAPWVVVLSALVGFQGY